MTTPPFLLKMHKPTGYFNYEGDMRILQNRFRVDSPQDYLVELLRRRTSQNGIFGFKAHYHHFKVALRQNRDLLERLAPLSYVYLHRTDRVAQAVSLAKALQTRAWVSLGDERRLPLFYSREFVTACLDELKQQDEDWRRWFHQNQIEPMVISYEDLMRNPHEVVQNIADITGVGEVTKTLELPRVERQSDHVNDEWIAKYRADEGL
jgi:LPS sulfotransferase NodH